VKVEEWTIKIFLSMYEGVKTSVRIDGGESKEFGVWSEGGGSGIGS